MKAIEILMAEHQVILHKLNDIAGMLADLKHEHLSRISDYMKFIQVYADEFHHAKEEGILFPWMIEQNPDFQFGPIACMLKEHDSCRTLVQNVLLTLQNSEIKSDDLEDIKNNLQNFISILSYHIGKEDNVLYQMALEQDQKSNNGDACMMPGFMSVETQLGDKARLIEASAVL